MLLSSQASIKKLEELLQRNVQNLYVRPSVPRCSRPLSPRACLRMSRRISMTPARTALSPIDSSVHNTELYLMVRSRLREVCSCRSRSTNCPRPLPNVLRTLKWTTVNLGAPSLVLFRQRRGQHDLGRHRLPAEGAPLRPPSLGIPPPAPPLGVLSLQYSRNEYFTRRVG